MSQIDEPARTEEKFFDALLRADTMTLGRILTDDFILVDVMAGSLILKVALLDALASGQLKFDSIDMLECNPRQYGDAAITVGATRMRGRFADAPFATHSRYTHVFLRQNGVWRMASAQGTQIVSL